jgi:hypothetical protein
MARSTLPDLKAQIDDLAEDFPHLPPEERFLVWFLHAYLIDDAASAAKALTGASKDKGIDAALVDDRARRAFIIQGKYHQTMTKTEKRSDVISFAELGGTLWGPSDHFREFREELDPLVASKLENLRDRLFRRDHYGLELLYVTSGRCSKALRSEAGTIARRASGSTNFALVDGKQLLAILDDYLDGVGSPSSLAGPPYRIWREGPLFRSHQALRS